MMNDLANLWLPAIIAGLGGFLIYKAINVALEQASKKRLYERSHLYAIIMEDKRVRGETLDDLSAGFDLRDRWYGLKGIKFEDKIALILAGYRIESAHEAYASIRREDLKVQAHLRTGYSSFNN
jgi:hypothetical protein